MYNLKVMELHQIFIHYVFQNLVIGRHCCLSFSFTFWFSSSNSSFLPVTGIVTELTQKSFLTFKCQSQLSCSIHYLHFNLNLLGFLQECNLIGTVSVFPCKLCLINLFLFQRCNFFRRTENFKNKLQIEIAFLVAYLFTEYYMCIYLNEGSINGA